MKLLLLISAFITLATNEIHVNKRSHLSAKLSTQEHIDVSPRIINGEEVKPHSIPYQAWLTITGSDGDDDIWTCGGVLISNNYVLTSGSCGLDAISATIVLGAHDITKNESTQVEIQGKKITVHENYIPDEYTNDISIIELEEPVSFNENIQPVKLPTRKDINNTYAGQEARVSGWGITFGFDEVLSPVLNAAESPILENSECGMIFNNVIVNVGTICLSGDNRKSACLGDGGGPITTVSDGTLIGIVTFTAAYCPEWYPTASVRITHYLDWIEVNSDVTLM